MIYEEQRWRAEVTRHTWPRPTGNLAVYVWRKRGDGTVDYVQPLDLVIQNFRSEELTTTDAGPSLQLDDDMAIALLNALAAYFGGTSDVLRLGKDLAAERSRVDKFIAYLTREAS